MKSIDVTLSVEPDMPEVVGDFDRLVQVIANLVGNAVQYSNRGSRVWVRMAAGDPVPPAKRSRASRSRTNHLARAAARRPKRAGVRHRSGAGIDSEALSKIFTRFFRAGDGSGTGLGLVISARSRGTRRRDPGRQQAGRRRHLHGRAPWSA